MLSDGYHDVPDGYLAMVVTYLEMTEPAPLRGVPLPEGCAFVPLARDVDVYRDVFRRVGQEWLWFGHLLLDDATLSAHLNSPEIELWTLEKDGTPEALLGLKFEESGACELEYFGLTAKLIGSGAGAYLMDRAIEMAWSRDITRFKLHTCTLDSPQAMAFYKRSGFTPYRRAIEVAEDPRTLGIYPQSAAPGMPIIKPGQRG
ncbi:GNAT family N-acetyltransferase [Aliishimia ponticola]|uniref:GNAT family N-acetyltransferase n=1 Tax=Aliishimia ponticola TaxID=2499833 RepID=A0A4S4N887_9RHOB|nr:GNAT family N-acetyltransferase [Aliishimia ponticola]THH35412.1 GNAT family N-acetyltransferase [Aliishimia ponticola]